MPRNPEIPSEILDPAYWDGHNLFAECGLDHPASKMTFPRLGLIKDLVIEWKLNWFSKEVLKNYMRLSSKGEPIRYPSGKVFDGHSFQPGTVLRLHHMEHLFFAGLKEDELIYYPYSCLAVICQSPEWPPEARALLKYNEKLVSAKNVYSNGHPEDCIISVGSVTHSLPLPKIHSGSLKRINLIEVLQLGKGVPAEKSEGGFRAALSRIMPVFG